MPRRLLTAAGGGAGAFLPGYVADGNLVLTGPAFAIDSGAGYKAFPGLTRMSSGDLLLVYRRGAGHVGDNGTIVGRTSSDDGETWSSEYTIYDPSDDARDPNVTTLSDGRVALACFRYSPGTSTAYQVEVLFSSDDGATWGSPVVANKFYSGNGVTYAQAALSGPVVEVSPSLFLLPVYMRNAGGATNWNAFVAKSTDSGASFGTNVLIATATHSWTEPWITRDPDTGDLLCTIRADDIPQTWTSRSTDNGVTWSTAAASVGGAALQSRMAAIVTANGALFSTVREGVGDGQGQYVTSWDFGVTWEPLLDLPSPSTVYDYGSIVQCGDGRILLVWANAASNGPTETDCDIYGQFYFDTGA